MTTAATNTKTGIDRAYEILGSVKRLAEVADVSIQQAHQWITDGESRRPVPAERAPLIERATGVPCEELCPKVPWGMVRGDDETEAA